MKTLTAKTLASEILTVVKQFGGLNGGTMSIRLSTGEVASVTIPAPEVAPKFTAGSRYHGPRQLPTAGQLLAIREFASSVIA